MLNESNFGKSGSKSKELQTLHGQPSSRNELEIQFFGLQRSGNHAVLSWIFRQFEEPVCFLNNVRKFEDPFLAFRPVRLPNTMRLRPGPVGDHPEQIAERARMRQRLENARQQEKALLAYSYENFPLQQLSRRALITDKEEKTGSSAQVRRVLLLRDFYNWIASRLRLQEKRIDGMPGEQIVDRLISEWLRYAREYSGETQYLHDETVVRISYSGWLADETYRISLLEQLAVPLKDNSIDHVPNVGGGSSFDGVANSELIQTGVNDRWRYLLENRFAGLVEPIHARRSEIEQYNHNIFDQSWPFAH